ncbi:MAG TPA: prepilin-type N-terminal cleavage/methylation domain-containing protein [Syntrophales bacterium]|nr:prepilin-type N-terminal cleavage/methylation domain-containing protein [Syntrophales bacterium]
MKKQAGFTLVELSIVLLVTMILLGSLFGFYVSQIHSFRSQELTINTLQNSRIVMSVMTKDIRMAGYKPSGSSMVGVAQATPATLQILSDKNLDGSISGASEDVIYSFDVNTHTVSRNGIPLLDNVELLSFVYTLDDGSTTQTPGNLSKIRKINLTLRVLSSDIDPLTKDYKRYEFITDITPRNLPL